MPRRIFLILVVMSFCFINNVFPCSQSEAEQEEWNPPSAGPITTWTACICGKGKLTVQPFLFYNRTRGVFDDDGRYSSLPSGDKKYQFQEQIFAQFGLTDRLEVAGQVVYQQNYAKESGNSANSNGFGDSYAYLRYCLIEETKAIPHITVLYQLRLPTGKYQHADPGLLETDIMGNGSYDNGLGINLTKKFKPFIFHADAIYNIPLETNIDDIATRYGRYFNYDFGVEYFLPKGFNLMLEFNGFVQGDTREDGERIEDSNVNYLTIGSGIGWSNDKIQTLLAYQRVITGKNTDANDSVVLTFVYTF